MKPANRVLDKKTQKLAAFIGVGLDHEDGHTRLTRGKNFVLWGGSQETHARMQETAVKVNEQLDRQGKRLTDVTPREFCDILDQATR